MAVSRRSFIASLAASSALAAGAGDLFAAGTADAASPVGDVVGKITVGYQGWFAAIGDGSPINAWWHWSANWAAAPSPANNGTLRAWPDMRDYTRGYATAYANLGNGAPATLFSHYDQQTVDAHFQMMQANGCDTAALQRFNPNGSEGPIRNAVTTRVRGAAERFGRKFYIMYDVSGWTNMQSEIKADWTTLMSTHTSSTAYARQNGKPVVGIWGFGFADGNHPWAPDVCLDVITWFKGQGCYVMGGVPTYWRTGINDSRAGYLDTYHALNMISPWMVGRIGNAGDSDSFYTNVNVGDQADCNARGIDYQPCVLPGDVSARQRAHGDFMWRQFYNMVRAGAQGIYISMFDEFNEGNQIVKTAENASQLPTNSGLLGLDEDGTACSSDYYLRLTNDGGRMLKGQVALTPTRPTPPIVSTVDNQAPSIPQNLAVTGHSDTTVSLSWSASTDNVGVAGYRVYSVAGANHTQLASTAATSAVLTGLTASTAYTLVVAAFDGAGNLSGYSGTVTVTTGAATTNLALHKPTTESSHNQTFTGGNATDGDQNTYWESANNAFPQWLQVDLGASATVARVVLTLPASWGARNQTVAVTGSTDGTSFTTLAGSASYAFNPSSANTVTIAVSGTARHVRVTVTANSGWPAAQLSELQVFGAGGATPPPTNPNLARGMATAESGHVQTYASGNAVDGDSATYWESANNAFPQWVQVDLGAAAAIGRLVLTLPPPSSWATRTQTLSVATSTDGSSFTTRVNSTGYTFNPASGNTVTITFAAVPARFVRLTITGNTGWPAGQLSELEVYAS